VEQHRATDGEHRTVSRVMSILEAVAGSPGPVTLTALRATLDAPKSSVHGLVRGLVSTGYLRDDAGGYILGPALSLLARDGEPAILRSARPSLQALSAATGESATLCMPVGDSIVYVDIVPGAHLIRYSPPLNVRRPLYPPSAGKCVLAQMPLPRRTRYLRSLFSDDDSAIQAALRELDQVARVGYATNRGETVPEVFAAASPIVWRGEAVACLQVTGPESRLAERLDDIAVLVRAEAQRLSESAA
jgi:DNA-binding IclR family transcriptional regulator